MMTYTEKSNDSLRNGLLRGPVVDARIHDLIDDTWMLCKAGLRTPLVIGTREQIISQYDKINESGEIPDFRRNSHG